MFDFSFAEIALVVVVAVIFIGPKELPVVIKTLAKAYRWFKTLLKEFRGIFDDIARESGLNETADDITREVRMIKGDDGQFYESYDLPHQAKKTPPPAPPKEDMP